MEQARPESHRNARGGAYMPRPPACNEAGRVVPTRIVERHTAGPFTGRGEPCSEGSRGGRRSRGGSPAGRSGSARRGAPPAPAAPGGRCGCPAGTIISSAPGMRSAILRDSQAGVNLSFSPGDDQRGHVHVGQVVPGGVLGQRVQRPDEDDRVHLGQVLEVGGEVRRACSSSRLTSTVSATCMRQLGAQQRARTSGRPARGKRSTSARMMGKTRLRQRGVVEGVQRVAVAAADSTSPCTRCGVAAVELQRHLHAHGVAEDDRLLHPGRVHHPVQVLAGVEHADARAIPRRCPSGRGPGSASAAPGAAGPGRASGTSTRSRRSPARRTAPCPARRRRAPGSRARPRRARAGSPAGSSGSWAQSSASSPAVRRPGPGRTWRSSGSGWSG